MKIIWSLALTLVLGCDVNPAGECFGKCSAMRIGYPTLIDQTHSISEGNGNSWATSEYEYDTDVKVKCCCFAIFKSHKSYYQKVWVTKEKCIFTAEDFKQ